MAPSKAEKTANSRQRPTTYCGDSNACTTAPCVRLRQCHSFLPPFLSPDTFLSPRLGYLFLRCEIPYYASDLTSDNGTNKPRVDLTKEAP